MSPNSPLLSPLSDGGGGGSFPPPKLLLLSLLLLLSPSATTTTSSSSSAAPPFPPLLDLAGTSALYRDVASARGNDFDFAFLLLDGQEAALAALDSFGGYHTDDDGDSSSSPSRLPPLVPTSHSEVMGGVVWDEEGEALVLPVAHKVLTVWSYSGTAANVTALLSSLPKRPPRQEVWILDGSGEGEAEKAIRSSAADAVPFDSQVYIFSPLVGNGSSSSPINNNVLISEIYSLPGNRYQDRAPMTIVRPLATYDVLSGALSDLGHGWCGEEEEEVVVAEGAAADVGYVRRRADLNNMSLSLVVEVSMPECFIDSPVKPREPVHHLHGSFVDIIEELSTTLNFRPSYFRSPTPLWSDLIQSLADKDYDLSATNSAITIDRSKLVDFSVPISAVNYMMVIQKPRRSLSWTTYITPFNPVFWVCGVINVVVCSLALFFATNTESSGGQALKLTLGESAAMCFLAMVNIGAQVVPTRLSSRVLFLGILISGTVFWASYQASLTSTLTVIISRPPITNLGEALSKGFKIASWKGTAIEEIMANSKPGTNPRKAWDDIIMKNSNSRLTVSEGLQAATNDAKMAFIVTDGMVQFSGYYPCNVTFVPTYTVASMASGIAYSKNFPLKPLFDYYIHKLLESGQYRRFVTRWSPVLSHCAASEISIGFDNIVSAFVALAAGAAVALLAAAAERAAPRRGRWPWVVVGNRPMQPSSETKVAKY